MIGLELIDTCCDVNNIYRCRRQWQAAELIDTCWDVNRYSFQLLTASDIELIDTCWDVNLITALARLPSRWN